MAAPWERWLTAVLQVRENVCVCVCRGEFGNVFVMVPCVLGGVESDVCMCGGWGDELGVFQGQNVMCVFSTPAGVKLIPTKC